MGFVKKIFSAPKPTPQPVVAAPAETGESAADIEAAESKKKKQAILSANAGSSSGGTTVGGGNASTTKKTLLGL